MTLAARTGPPPTALRVIGDAALGIVVAWILSWAYHVAQVAEVIAERNPYRPGSGPPWMSNPPTEWVDLPWHPYAIGIAVLIGIATAVRGRLPRVAGGVVAVLTAVYLLIGGPFPAALVAPVICTLTLARVRPVTEWWIPVAVGTVMLWSAQWPEPWLGLNQALTYFQIVFGLAVIMVPAMVRVMRRDRHQAVAERRAEELRRAADAERLRLAREVHDVVGHSLSMISLQAGVALHVLERNPEQVRASLQAIRDGSKSSLAELRQTLGALRSSRASDDGASDDGAGDDGAGDDAGTDAVRAPVPDLRAVTDVVARVRAAGRAVSLRIDGDPETVPGPQQQAAHRIIQESLTNAVRHAPGAQIAVSVEIASDRIVIEVANGGPAGKGHVEVGHGLRGISERVAALGGTVSYGYRDVGGFAVTAELPLAGPGDRPEVGPESVTLQRNQEDPR